MKTFHPLLVQCDSGMKDGQQIRFSGEGDQEPSLEPGDVVIILEEKEHSTFQRHGQDLITSMQITLVESLCGMQKTITTLDKRTLVISTIPGMLIIHILQLKKPYWSYLCFVFYSSQHFARLVPKAMVG